MTTESGFVYPIDIHLASKPLNEAWLEMQWRTADAPELAPGPIAIGVVDTNYQWALSAFYNEVSSRFSVREPLPQAQFPLDMIPHMVTYRFRTVENGWPLLQFGPGVATMNFTQSDYTSWTAFRTDAAFLRQSVNAAYAGVPVHLTQIFLRYRDIFPFDHSSGDIKDYLSTMLNIDLQWPVAIPGQFSKRPAPANFSLLLGFQLGTPEAIGTLRLSTATQVVGADAGRPILLAEFEMRGDDVDPSLLADEHQFLGWLDRAHAVIHDWFFALIEGKLRSQYETGE